MASDRDLVGTMLESWYHPSIWIPSVVENLTSSLVTCKGQGCPPQQPPTSPTEPPPYNPSQALARWEQRL